MNIDVDELIEEIKELRIRVTRLEAERSRPESRPATSELELAAGDRIRITNRIRKPSNWPEGAPWTEENERKATVTRVTDKQVHFRTDNGTTTWRAPRNVKKIK